MWETHNKFIGRKGQCQIVEDPCKTGKNDCDKNALCIKKLPSGFDCSCGEGFRDANPSNPGRQCDPS
jgi:hypothetical protein